MWKIKFLFLSIFLIGCGIKIKTEDNFSNKSDEVIRAKIGRINIYSDPFIFNSVEISGNYLLLEITYKGGSEKHDFKFIGSSTISKSMPPIRDVQLINLAIQGSYNEEIVEKLKVDISELAYKKEKGSKIYFKLIGWEKRLEYVFE
jgi:hypothetical protein